jgi:multisubunit Na+/H+ antiporter MnhG subunit
MSFDDWLLALHLLSAFALVAALVVFSVAIVVLRRTDLPEQARAAAKLATVGNVVVVVGSLAVIVFGIWLAIALDGVEVWNGWVIAAIVLWAASSALGRRAGQEFEPCLDRAAELVAAGQTGPDARLAELGRTQKGQLFHVISTLLTLLILVDMIWKPGA